MGEKHQATTGKEKEKMGIHKTEIPRTKEQPKEKNYFSQKEDSDEEEEETKMPCCTPKKDEQRETGFSPKKNEAKETTGSGEHRPRA